MGPKLTVDASGTDPLGSDPRTLSSAAPKCPKGGTPAGGTENNRANFTTLSSSAAKLAKGNASKTPGAVRTYRDGVGK